MPKLTSQKGSSQFLARRRRSWRRTTGFLATIIFFKRDLASLMAFRRMAQFLYFVRVFGGISFISQAIFAAAFEVIQGRPWLPAFVFMLVFGALCMVALFSFLESETEWSGRLRPHRTIFWASPLIFTTFGYLLSLVLYMRMGYISVWAGFPRFDLLLLNWFFLAGHTGTSVFLCRLWQKSYENKLNFQNPS